MLQFQVVQAPLRFGLAEGVDPHQVPFGTLVTAENACWTRTGTLGKRKGSTALSTGIVGGGNISLAKRLIVRGTELNLTDGTTLYTYFGGSWTSRGRHPEMGLRWSTISDSLHGAKSSDVAYLSNGQVVHAWVTGDPNSADDDATDKLYYQVLDLASGTVVTQPTLLGTGVGWRIRLVASGSSWVLLWGSGANLNSHCEGNTTTLKTDLASIDPNGGLRMSLDACIIGSEFVVAYALEGGGVRLVRYTIASIPVQQATATVTGETATTITAITIDGAAGETLYIGYHDAATTNARFAAANPSTLAQTVAPTTIEATAFNVWGMAIVRETSSRCTLVYAFYNTTTQPSGMMRVKAITNAGVITSGGSAALARPIARPWLMNGRVYAAIASSNEPAIALIGTAEALVVDVTVDSSQTIRQVGKTDVYVGSKWCDGYVSNVATVSSTRAIYAAPFQATSAIGSAPMRNGVRLVDATIGASVPSDVWCSTTIGQEVHLSAGVLTAYDGVEAFPYGFAHSPYVDKDSATSSSGGSMATGTYLYNITAERRSYVGLLHRGPVGIGISRSVTGPSGKVTVAVTPVQVQVSSLTPALLPIYRSVANGSIVQRLTREPTSAAAYNVTGAAPFLVEDTFSDTSISLSSRPALYTESGELEDVQPPSSLTHMWHQNRIWLLAGDGRTVWISKDYSSSAGTVPGFHPDVTLPFDRAVTAMASMDEKAVVFAEDMFWYVIGDGPAPNGQGADWRANSVQTDVGCSNPRSVVSTPDGVMFQSVRGIQLLTRSLEVVWIGRPVKDALASFPTITSAVLVAAKNEVRFTCNNAGATASTVLIYNYVEKQWTTARYTVGGVYGAPIADAVMWNGTWTFVTTSGTVVQENDASYLDGATWVPLTIETAWVNASGPLAYQSVRRFTLEGVSNSNHDLTVSVGFDSETSYPQTKTFTAGSSVTSIGPFEACWITIGTRRKCQAIRFKLTDATPTNPGTYPVGTGQGPTFDMLGIEVGLKKGLAIKNAMHMG